jgi:DNA-binding PadR family transcriptional regulator
LALLTPLSFHILLALAAGDLTPVQLITQIAGDSVSAVLPSESTFYKALKRLKTEGMIGVSPGFARAITLTARGRQVLRAESTRYLNVASAVRSRRIV